MQSESLPQIDGIDFDIRDEYVILSQERMFCDTESVSIHVSQLKQIIKWLQAAQKDMKSDIK